MRTQRTNLLAILQFNFAIPSSGFRRLRQIANCFCHCVTHTRLATVGLETNRVITFTTEKKGNIINLGFYRNLLNKLALTSKCATSRYAHPRFYCTVPYHLPPPQRITVFYDSHIICDYFSKQR